ncbi:hypothetical protein ACIQUL_34205 [Streptomyces sp. NPDC090303]|uniref:hypothetical protein n=1 Tax=Streptomyces sp. NPDC090303 TaxID=3365960 RepID=UPI00382B2EDB
MIDEQVVPLATELQETVLALSADLAAVGPQPLAELCVRLWNQYGAWYEAQREGELLTLLEEVLSEGLWADYWALATRAAQCEPLDEEWLAEHSRLQDATHQVLVAVHEREGDRTVAAHLTAWQAEREDHSAAGPSAHRPGKAGGEGASRADRARRKARAEVFARARQEAADRFDTPKRRVPRQEPGQPSAPVHPAPVPEQPPAPVRPAPEPEAAKEPPVNSMWGRRDQIQARNLDVYKRYKKHRVDDRGRPSLVPFAVYNSGTQYAIVVLDPWSSEEQPTYRGSVFALEQAGGLMSKAHRFLRSGAVAREAWAGDLAVMSYEGPLALDELRVLLKAGKITDKRVVEVAPIPPDDPRRDPRGRPRA